jgi:hypothetical protein
MNDLWREFPTATKDSIVNGGAAMLYAALAIASLCLIARTGFDVDLHNALWAEDGLVFLNQAHQFGARAIWTPYAGYLHLYPRLVSWLATQFPLIDRPLVLCAGWLISYFTMVTVVTSCTIANGLSRYWVLCTVAAICAQPAGRELFLNITNSQWMLGTALFCYVLLPPPRPPRIGAGIFLVLAGLSGPFSVLVLPIIFWRWRFASPRAVSSRTMQIIAPCALIQIVVIAASNRVTSTTAQSPISDWVIAASQVLRFGATNRFAIVAAILFWMLLLGRYWLLLRSDAISDRRIVKVIEALLISAFIIIGGAMFSERSHIHTMQIWGTGNRYTWIPYTLLFISLAYVSNKWSFRTSLAMISIATICLYSFSGLRFDDVQFRSFANFAQYVDVSVPTAPNDPSLPPFFLDATGEHTGRSLPPAVVVFPSSRTRMALPHNTNPSDVSSPSLADVHVLSDIDPVHCESARDIAIDVEMGHATAGALTLFWTSDQNLDQVQSLQRRYGVGPIHAQFAFPNGGANMSLRLVADHPLNSFVVTRIAAYCLP